MARELRDDAKNKLAAGINPVKYRQLLHQEAVTNANSFETIAREWYDRQLSNLAESTKSRIKIRLENDVFPTLGEMNISEITAPDILTILRRVESRDALETAKRILQYCGRIFRYAIATGRAQRDISVDLKDALPPSKVKHFPSLTKPKDVINLLKSIDNFHGNFIVRSALQISSLVFLRPVELRLGQWHEIDFKKSEWHIPENRMKMKEKHIVPLSRQAIRILHELQPYTRQSKYLFPSPRTFVRPISDATLLNALRSMGFTKEQMTVHGFRSMASTLLNEQGYNRDWIERQLAHGDRDKIRATYNYAEYLPERRQMMQEWADYLDGLRSNDNKDG